MLVLADTHVFTPQVVNIARFGYMRFDGISAVANPILAADLGTQSPTGESGGTIVAPGITIDGLFTVGDAGTPSQWQVTNSFIWQDTVAATHGNHTMRIGAEVKRHQVDVEALFAADGLLDIRTFNDFLLGQSAAQNGSPSGSSNVSLSNGSSGLFRKDERYTDFAAFFQDDVKVRPSLTLNAGLRYEIFGAPSDINGRLVTFDPTIASRTAPPDGTLSGFVVPSNFPEEVPDGVIRSSIPGLFPTVYHDVSPRFGFAWRIADRPTVVLRGGYGIYFNRLSAGLSESLLAQEPFSTFQFFAGSSNGGATLQQPFVPLLPSNSSYPTWSPRIPGGGPSIAAVSRTMTDPYTQEYNLNAQIALGRDYLLELGYVGTRSLHVAGCTEFNQAQLASPTNPLNGETTNSAANVIQRLPYVGVSPGSLLCESSFNINYNSLQTSLTKRLSHGLQFLASYTWSRNLDQTSGSSGSRNIRDASGYERPEQLRPGIWSNRFRPHESSRCQFRLHPPISARVPTLLRYPLRNWQISASSWPRVARPSQYSTTAPELCMAITHLKIVHSSAVLLSRDIGFAIHSRRGRYESDAFTSAPEAPYGDKSCRHRLWQQWRRFGPWSWPEKH